MVSPPGCAAWALAISSAMLEEVEEVPTGCELKLQSNVMLQYCNWSIHM